MKRNLTIFIKCSLCDTLAETISAANIILDPIFLSHLLQQ